MALPFMAARVKKILVELSHICRRLAFNAGSKVLQTGNEFTFCNMWTVTSGTNMNAFFQSIDYKLAIAQLNIMCEPRNA